MLPLPRSAFLIGLCVTFNVFFVFAAQPRSSFIIDLDGVQSELPPLVHYGKLLQSPFTYTQPYTQPQDSKTADSVIQARHLINLPPPPPPQEQEVQKLSSKRIRRPKKHLRQFAKDAQKASVNEFIIYVPEDEDLVPAPIIINDLPAEDQGVQESHHPKKHQPKDSKYEKGKGKEGHKHKHATSVDEGEKSHKGVHKNQKVEKEHHAKVGKAGHHEDKGGDEKHFEHDSDAYDEHHEDDDGKKGSEFEEDGENEKGHATQGTHNVHKKDEYVKNIEFFDEYHEDSDLDADGGHEDDDSFEKKKHHHKEHENLGHEGDRYGHEDSFEHKEEHANKKAHHDDHSDEHNHDLLDKHMKKLSKDKGKKKIWKVVVEEGSMEHTKQ